MDVEQPASAEAKPSSAGSGQPSIEDRIAELSLALDEPLFDNKAHESAASFPYIRGLAGAGARPRLERPRPDVPDIMAEADVLKPAGKVSAPVPESVRRSSPDQLWDDDAVEALHKIYDEGETSRSDAKAARSAPLASERRPEPAVFATPQPAATPLNAIDVPASIGLPQSETSGQRASLLTSKDRAWLDDRLAEIAAQVEQSIAGIRPDRTLAAIGKRFDVLENRLEQAIGASTGVPAPFDGAPLDALDKQVNTLAQQVGQMSERIAGLDELKAELEHMSGQLGLVTKLESDSARMLEQVAGARTDLTHFARLVMGDGTPHVTNAGSEGRDSRLEELHSLIEAHAHERRESETATVNVLMAMQEAIDRLTDRVSDGSGAGPDDESLEPPRSFGTRGAPVRSQPAPEVDEPISPSEPEPELPITGRGPRRSFASATPEPRVEPEVQREMEPDRAPEDVVRAARRARVLASAKGLEVPDVGEQIRAVQSDRAKLQTKKRSLFAGEGRGLRPLHLLLVAAPLALGAGILWGVRSGDVSTTGAPPATREAPVPLTNPRPSPTGAPAQPNQPPQRSGARDDSRDTAPVKGDIAGPLKTASIDAAASRSVDVVETAANLAPAAIAERRGVRAGSGLTAGIIVDAPAPMSAADVRRVSHDTRTAQLSAQVGSKAVELPPTLPVAQAQNVVHTPAPATPVTQPAATALVAPPSDAAPSVTSSNTGLPPAAIGPMSLRVAAAKGDPSAAFEVATRFAHGKGVPKDMAQAADWFQRAAAKGSAPAQYRLAGLYERGLGVKADPLRSRLWYKRAAELGNVKAMHNLAVLHSQHNEGKEPEYTDAAHWFQRAAEHGLADSQFNFAILRQNGLGVAKSDIEAYRWFALAGERGDEEARRRAQALGLQMKPQDLAAAKKIVATWRPKPTDPVANDPSIAGQAWRSDLGAAAAALTDLASAPQRPRVQASRPRVAPREAEIIDLTDAALEAKAPKPAAAPAAPETAPVQPTAVDSQNEADVERMLKQMGYNPDALKKAASKPAE
jgi:localization factor PodJL